MNEIVKMKRVKKRNVKKEKPEASSSQFREEEEHDLAYYIHDRVELVHQVFSVLKYKDLKALAPGCVRHISIGDLQELCTEELLGISSKRLCAILDGAEPPSDTESSSRSPSPPLETISLDSISSDEEILSQTSKKKRKHKHRRRDSSHSKSKSRKKKSKESPSEDVEKSKASRAGLTVLELLELQARARAIRAQLQQEQAAKQLSETAAPDSSHHSSDDEVEIKEEPADVVEISSEDEKPNIDEIPIEHPKSPVKQNSPTKQLSPVKQPTTQLEETKSTKDLVITVPQVKPTRKIKLNRNNVTVSVANVIEKVRDVTSIEQSRTATIVPSEAVKLSEKTLSSVVEKVKPKLKRKKKVKKEECVEEDHDEITLQLSDSEKMDLLQDLDRKALENVSSSEDSESSSESDSQSDGKSSQSSPSNEGKAICKVVEKNLDSNPEAGCIKTNSTVKRKVIGSVQQISILDAKANTVHEGKADEIMCGKKVQNCTDIKDLTQDMTQDSQSSGILEMEANTQDTELEKGTFTTNNENESVIPQIPHEKCIYLSPKKKSKCKVETEDKVNKGFDDLKTSSGKDPTDRSLEGTKNSSENVIEISTIEDIPLIVEKNYDNTEKSGSSSNTIEHYNKCEAEIEKEMSVATAKATESNLSEGEISDGQSCEVETIGVKPQVVCISDEEGSSKKKKKKKDKKSKKVKSKKSKSDFRECADENFYKNVDNETDNRKSLDGEMEDIKINRKGTLDIEEELIYIDDDDDIYEILEISDDSSCYEVEGTVLSKEPTTEEILALSAKIDKIEREEVVTEEQIRIHDRMLGDGENNGDNVENISWKDRYLGSNKVKKVLTTSNILNALRKKNKELKRKLEDSKNQEEIVPAPLDTPAEKHLEEGTIEHYNMLQGSTTFVDPVKGPGQIEMEKREQLDKSAESGEQNEILLEQNAETRKLGVPMEQTEKSITKEMKKDAKRMLKMYRRLLKYNDNNIDKDPNKKKKKKIRKKIKKVKSVLPL